MPPEKGKKRKRNGPRLLARSEQLLKIALQCVTFFGVDHCKDDTHQGHLARRLACTVISQRAPKHDRTCPGQAEQERYAQEYEAKQRAYEDALKQAEHYAASKETM